MISIIRNSDILRLKKSPHWKLVYGRRKTGKTYLIKNFTKWDKFYFVGRDGTIYESMQSLSYDSFLRELSYLLKEGKSIVVDEFQRLPQTFLDLLHSMQKTGKLTLISSTLSLTEKIIAKHSPILGLFGEIKIGLIDEKDILLNLREFLKGKELIEACVYLREPWLIPFFERNKKGFIPEIFLQSKLTIPALIGEIFWEEDRKPSKVYLAILKAVSDGKRTSSEIADHLYSLKLIEKNSPSLIHPYLDILSDLGILERVKETTKQKYYYFHSSSVMDTYYYLDAKYGFGERDIANSELRKAIDILLGRHVEQFMSNLSSKIFGLKKEKLIGKDFEIDIVLSDLKKPKIAIEVKWTKNLKPIELKKIYLNMMKLKVERKIIILPQKPCKKFEDIELWDVSDIVSLLK